MKLTTVRGGLIALFTTILVGCGGGGSDGINGTPGAPGSPDVGDVARHPGRRAGALRVGGFAADRQDRPPSCSAAPPKSCSP